MTSDPLSLAFSALADPTRRAILARLMAGEASAGVPQPLRKTRAGRIRLPEVSMQ